MSQPKFVVFVFHPVNGWRTWDAETLDDAIGIPCALAILACAPDAPSKVFDGKRWVARPHSNVAALICGMKMAYPQRDKPQPSNLDEVTGLSPATKENTPDIAGDPELFGEGRP